MFDETQASDSQPDFTAVMATTAIGNRGESTVGAGRAIAPPPPPPSKFLFL